MTLESLDHVSPSLLARISAAVGNSQYFNAWRHKYVQRNRSITRQNSPAKRLLPIDSSTATQPAMLKPLLLPQIVEQRRKREGIGETEMESSAAYFSHNSSASDLLPSPVTPTFSTRSHIRYASSASSMELSPNTPASPTSPTFFLK